MTANFQGYATEQTITGTGSPIGIITPSAIGIYYVDLLATNGAARWVSTGLANSQWSVVEDDTGWRSISTLFSGWAAVSNTDIRIRRIGGVVFYAVAFNSQSTSSFTYTVPVGFTYYPFQLDLKKVFANPVDGSYMGGWATVAGGPSAIYYSSSTQTVRHGFSHPTSDAWPLVLPGVPA